MQMVGEKILSFSKLPTGCTGALAHELIQIYPNMKVTVFDLPEVIANSSCFQPSERCTAPVTFVSGKRNIAIYFVSIILQQRAVSFAAKNGVLPCSNPKSDLVQCSIGSPMLNRGTVLLKPVGTEPNSS